MWVEVRNFYKHKSSPFRCKRTTFALHFGLRCIANGASLPSKSCPFGVQRSPEWLNIWHPPLPLHIKNASVNSRIEILFVTLFYCLYDICIHFFIYYPLAELFFIQFYRQFIGVAEEHKTLAGIFICAYWFVYNTFAVKFVNCLSQIVHFKCKMTQTCCFGIWWTHRRIGEWKQLHYIRRTKPTVCLPRITLLAIMLTDNS